MTLGALSVSMAVGDIAVLAISDGEFLMPRDFLSSPAPYDALAGHDGSVHLPVGAFLFPGDQPLLIDLGFGPGPPTTMLSGGSLLDQLALARYRAEDIELVALTHPHPDHVGWLATSGGPGALSEGTAADGYRRLGLLCSSSDG